MNVRRCCILSKGQHRVAQYAGLALPMLAWFDKWCVRCALELEPYTAGTHLLTVSPTFATTVQPVDCIDKVLVVMV